MTIGVLIPNGPKTSRRHDAQHWESAGVSSVLGSHELEYARSESPALSRRSQSREESFGGRHRVNHYAVDMSQCNLVGKEGARGRDSSLVAACLMDFQEQPSPSYSSTNGSAQTYASRHEGGESTPSKYPNEAGWWPRRGGRSPQHSSSVAELLRTPTPSPSPTPFPRSRSNSLSRSPISLQMLEKGWVDGIAPRQDCQRGTSLALRSMLEPEEAMEGCIGDLKETIADDLRAVGMMRRKQTMKNTTSASILSQQIRDVNRHQGGKVDAEWARRSLRVDERFNSGKKLLGNRRLSTSLVAPSSLDSARYSSRLTLDNDKSGRARMSQYMASAAGKPSSTCGDTPMHSFSRGARGLEGRAWSCDDRDVDSQASSCRASTPTSHTTPRARSVTAFEEFGRERMQKSQIVGEPFEQSPNRFESPLGKPFVPKWLQTSEDLLRPEAAVGARVETSRSSGCSTFRSGRTYDAAQIPFYDWHNFADRVGTASDSGLIRAESTCSWQKRRQRRHFENDADKVVLTHSEELHRWSSSQGQRCAHTQAARAPSCLWMREPEGQESLAAAAAEALSVRARAIEALTAKSPAGRAITDRVPNWYTVEATEVACAKEAAMRPNAAARPLSRSLSPSRRLAGFRNHTIGLA